MRLLVLLFIFCTSVAAANLPSTVDPDKIVKLRKGEVARYFRRGGGKAGKPPYLSLVVVRADYTVICKATDFESSFKMNQAQRRDWKMSMEYFHPERFDEGPRKEKGLSSAKDGGIDFYVSVRKNGKVYTTNNVKRKMGFLTIYDALDVFFYLERPKDKDGIASPPP